MYKKVIRKCSQLFNDSASMNTVKRKPGRVLRGRWLAIDSVELLLLKAILVLGAIFLAIFGNPDPHPAAVPVAD